MELRQLKYFQKAAELENFTEASKALYITQSTLSQQIKQLENELGLLLFERIGKRLYLTEAGKEFLPFAKRTIEDAELGKQRILDLQGIMTGKLKIGITYSLSFGLSNVIQNFMKSYPNIRLEIVYHNAQELLRMLIRRELDFVLSLKMPITDETVEAKELFEIPLCAIVNKIHPLAKQKDISIQDMKNYTLVLPSEGLSARSYFDRMMQESNLQLKPRMEINDVSILLRIVENSPCITVLSQATVELWKNLVAIPIKEQKEKMTATLFTIYGAYQKASAKAFLDLFNEELKIHNSVK